MKWFRNVKIQNKLLLTFGTLISILVVMSIYSGVKIFNVDKKYSDVLSSSIGRQSSTSKAIADMNRIYYINLSKGYLVYNLVSPDAIIDAQENYYINIGLLMRHLNEYRINVSTDDYFTGAEKEECLKLLDEITHLLVYEYQPKVKELDAALYSNNKQEINCIMERIIWAGDQITEKLDTLHNFVSFTAERISEETTVRSKQTMYLLFYITAFLIILSVFVSVFMTKMIKVPITQIENALFEISKGNLTYPIRSGYYDELGILANRIGDMVDNISEMNKVTTAMDNIDSLILVADLDYNLIYINRKLAETFGVDVERYKGKKCYRTLKEFDQPCSVCQMHKILPDKHLFPSRNYEFVYDDVLDAWMGGRSSIIRWVDGSMVYFQSAHNETEKKKSQEQLSEALQSAEKALSAKTLFLANMSHEIRTPLNVIIALTDLQLEESGLTEEIKDNLHKIHIAGNTLLSIVNDILDISKIDSGSFVLSPVEYHLASLLNDTTTLITSRIMDKPIAFFLNINDDLPSKLYGDDLRVKQILHNLLSNAIKYTHTGTIELSVDCVREGDNDVWMDIAVKDSGIGIHKEDLEKIFFDFNQVDTKANRKIEGTGLGLPITKKLAENMGGGISVESEHGKGSTFRVRIRQGFVSDTPIGLEIVENLRKLRYYENKRHFASSLVRVDLSYAKVLVVDDLQANLEVAAGLMRKYKMQVDCVNSGQAAIQRIEIGEPIYNAIFMDHMMPEMDGIEAADAIRAIDNSYARSIPIIALTANAVVGTEKLFYEHDFQAFITKPIDIMRLDSVLRQWVKTKSNNKPIDESQEKLVVPDIHVLDSLEEENDLKIEITGLDTEKGISICDGDLKIFRSVLRSYVADTSNVLDKIRDVSEESLPGYTVAVHGIKGSSANIGAEAIRAAAADLELIAKSGNLPAVLAKNDAFLKETECVVADIKGWLDKEVDKTTKQRLHAPDREVLARLRERCEDYDMDGIEQLMDELDSASYTTDADLVIWLREKIETFDLAEVAERLAEYK